MATKIAIIGSGISGLVSAYLLSNDFEVHLFEANDYLGGHTCTIDLEEENQHLNLDVGFMVFNKKTYPQFSKILSKEVIEIQESDMSFSYESYDKTFSYNGHSLATLFADPKNIYSLKFYSFLIDIVKFNLKAKKELKNKIFSENIGQFIKTNNFGELFVKTYLKALGAAVWSCEPNQVLQFPTQFFLQFLQNHGLLNFFRRYQWYVLKHGSKTYISSLIKNIKGQIHLNSPIRGLERNPHNVTVITDDGPLVFDKVIIATHSDQALSLLQTPSLEETEILKSIPYKANNLILHFDDSVLPKNKKCWASWNFSETLNNECTLTYYLNKLQSIRSAKNYCASMNLKGVINPNKIIKEFTFHHPLFSQKAIDAQQQFNQINGKNNTYYCGAYWGYGFHEDGVVSAIKTCDQLRASI